MRGSQLRPPCILLKTVRKSAPMKRRDLIAMLAAGVPAVCRAGFNDGLLSPPMVELVRPLSVDDAHLSDEELVRRAIDDAALPYTGPNVRLALIVGHNRTEQGAESSVLGSEYRFNSPFADLIKRRAEQIPGVELKVFLRTPQGSYSSEVARAYGEVDRWGAHLSMELHFNCADSSRAKGTQTLYYASSSKAGDFARAMQSKTVEALGRGSIWSRVIPKLRGNGVGALKAGKAPALILEPTFAASNRTEAELLKSRQEVLADCWLYTARNFARDAKIA